MGTTEPARPALVDANVLIDVLTADARWSAWSLNALAAQEADGGLVLNPIVYAELAPGFVTKEALDDALGVAELDRRPLPWNASFLAGQAFAHYRRRGGARRTPLPDFFLGAHAAVAELKVLTRDPRPIRSYFPTVEVIAPA